MKTGYFAWIGLVCLAISLAILAWLIRDPFEMTRLRNSLIADVGIPANFSWAPGQEPATYNHETLDPPSAFLEFVQAQDPDQSDFERALFLARELTRGTVTQGNPIQSTSADTLNRIVTANEGYCSDYTQVFNGILLAAGIPVREWGMSFDGFSGDGHAFSEFYDRAAKKWVFIDTFNSFYMVDAKTDLPVSVLEFREKLALGETGLADSVRFIDEDAFGMKDPATAINYYTRGVSEFFLWFANDVFSYDNDPLVRVGSRVGRSAEQAMAILTGIHPRMKIYPTDGGAPNLAALGRAKGLFIVAFCLGLIACTLLAIHFQRTYATRRERQAR